jgi:carnitine-CoA ligase
MSSLSVSQVALPSVHPFLGADVWSMLCATAAGSPQKPLLTWQPFDAESRTWTYEEFVAESEAVAAGLQERGVEAGDRVIIHMENCPEFLLAWFACAAIHAVAVTTNSRSSADELAYFIENSGARAAITQERFADTVRAADSQRSDQGRLDWVSIVGTAGPEAFEALPAPSRRLERPGADPAAPLSIQYTSGTTSRPKGVLWTQANGLWSGRVNALHEGLRSDDVHLVYMPLFHTNAMGYSVLASIWAGARFVLLPKWSTSRFWDISVEHGCTWVSLMGLSSRAVLASTPPENHSYRVFGGGGTAPLLEEHCGVRTIAWWGMTETVSHGTISDGKPSDFPGNMGRVAPEYEIAVRRADGTPAEVGETGELFVRGIRGLSLFAEYWNNPKATAEAFDEDGWMTTGDLVSVNPDGTMSFMDRAKDMLRVGAENVAASEIERVVQEAVGAAEIAVVGKPDASLEEVPVVFVVDEDPQPGAAERIIEACRSQLADFKVPREVHFVSALPRSTISKVHKVELRSALKSGEDLAAAEARWAIAAVADPSGDAGIAAPDAEAAVR